MAGHPNSFENNIKKLASAMGSHSCNRITTKVLGPNKFQTSTEMDGELSELARVSGFGETEKESWENLYKMLVLHHGLRVKKLEQKIFSMEESIKTSKKKIEDIQALLNDTVEF